MSKRIIVKQIANSGAVAHNIVEDNVQIIRDDETLPATGEYIVSLKRWSESKSTLQADATAGRLGVYLLPDDDPALLANDATTLARIAYEFPVFKFGQGYSDAVLLRTRYGFTGKLRAFGDIWRDQLFYLARVGFDEFDIKEGKSLEDALNGFADFSVKYQNSTDEALPLFRRRQA
jgi:uncharacterized protein (DUF934 family)